MIRFLVFILLLIPLMLAGDWLLSNQGQITIQWFDYTIQISTALAVFTLAACFVLVTVIFLLLAQLVQWPERRRARKRYRTLGRGLTHLTQGFTALALGDDMAAMASLKKARLALPNEPLPQLLSAQLLQRQGKHEEARGFLRALLKHDATAELATHKLIEQHMTRREWSQAIALAEPAHRDAPRDRWLLLTLIDLYAHIGNASAMLALTEGWQFRSPLEKTERHRIAALAHYTLAKSADELHIAQQHLQQAVNYAPEFLPALVEFSTYLATHDASSKARKLLRKAWLIHPSPLLIAPILLSIAAEKERQQPRLLKSFLNEPRRAAHYLLEAQYALDHHEHERAKPLLEAALALEESKHACAMMADVERELRGTQAANGWMARAMDAPTAESWLCDRCGHAHAHWHMHCGSCSAFDSLHFGRPEARITSVEVVPQ
jgi:HemY protein